MADEWLIRRLQVLDDPVTPDPTFGDELYGKLLVELGLDAPARLDRVATGQVKARNQSRRPGFLLVAALVIVGTAAAAVGAGGLINRGLLDIAQAAEAPHVCELITPKEIAAIVGFPVTLTVPEFSSSTGIASIRSCVYEYDAKTNGAGQSPNVVLAIARYADENVARTQMGPGPGGDYGRTSGLGEAVLYYAAGQVELLVLRRLDVASGGDVVSVGGSIGGVTNAITPDEMEAIARIILARL
jgi:hypothetical protein